MTEFVKGISDSAEQLERLKNISGVSSDTIQNLQYAMKVTGGDADGAGG